MSAETDAGKVLRCELTIVNSRGLHARASAKFVKCADSYDAQLTVSRDGQSAPGTSIMGLMMLAAGEGSTILVEATGREAEPALAAISELVASGFGERD